MMAAKARIVARFAVRKENADRLEDVVSAIERDAGDDAYEAIWSKDRSALTFKVEAEDRASLADLIERIGPHFEEVERHGDRISVECAGDIPSGLQAELAAMGATVVDL